MTRIVSPTTVLILEGTDAVAFAHAQFCSDVASLSDGQWQWSGWLDAQGRALHFFALLRLGPTQLLAWLPSGDAQAFATQLGRFVFRTRVSLDAPAGWSSAQPSGLAPAPRCWLAAGDGYALDIGVGRSRVVALQPDAATGVDEDAMQAWRLADIDDGLPLLAAQVSGMFVPQALGFEALGAVAHDKGCYPGQEIVARLHFRGGNKRHLYRVTIEGGAMPAAGEQLRTAQRDRVGTILYGTSNPLGGYNALTVLPQESAANGGLLTARGDTVSVTSEAPDPGT